MNSPGMGSTHPLRSGEGDGVGCFALTRHAEARMRQRGISGDVLDYLLDFGTVCHDHHGAGVIYFDKPARRRCLQALGRTVYRRLENRLNVYAVRGPNGDVLTVGHRVRRLPRS